MYYFTLSWTEYRLLLQNCRLSTEVYVRHIRVDGGSQIDEEINTQKILKGDVGKYYENPVTTRKAATTVFKKLNGNRPFP